MGWRNVQIYYMHAARDAGSAAISTNTSFETSKDFLIDDRGGSLCRMGATSANQYIQIDRGAGSIETIDYLFIPAGHVLGGCTIKIESSVSSSLTSPTTMLASTAISGSAAISMTLTSSALRYVRLTMETAGTKWQLGELFLTRLRTLTRGPEPDWKDAFAFPAEIYPKRTGARPAAEFGSKLRQLDFSFRHVIDPDLSRWLSLESYCGITRPFLLDAPFDAGASSGQIWCSLQSPIERSFDHGNPQIASEQQYRLGVSVLEWAS